MPEIPPWMHNKTCLITGATSGLGKAAALQLAQLGANVIIVGRSEARIGTALAEIRTLTGNQQVNGLCADLSIQSEVRRVAEQIQRRNERLDVLINNVGATILKYEETRDGVEKTWALNYLNHFLLTTCLLDRLKLTAEWHGEARIIELTSSIYRWSTSDFSRRQNAHGYNGVLAYAQAKRATITLAAELSRRVGAHVVTINAVTPGFVATGIAQRSVWWADMAMFFVRRFSMTVEEGVKPIVALAVKPQYQGINGAYFMRDKQMPVDPSTADERAGKQLWSISEEMIRQ